MIEDFSVEEGNRFWAKVNKNASTEAGMPSNCWCWTGAKTSLGYGAFCSRRRTMGAHRVAWILAHGAIPGDLLVRHMCDVRTCVRPDHLVLGTQKQNIADMDERRRRRSARKLSTGDAKIIRELSLAGQSQRTLAAQFRVDRKTVSNIIKGIYYT